MTARRLLEDGAVRRMFSLLDGDGEEARIVGGAVRNALLERPATDIDVTTTAVPTVVVARAAAAGLRTIPTGVAHGTVTVLIDGRPFEVTTLREDIETDGRHAVIRFGRDFVLDAQRRDFTINALSMGADGEVHDYAGGLADLAAGRVRFIGDPATRIREDHLRSLRFFRFSADYAVGDLDAAGLAAVVRERAGLARLSRERVRQEVLKLLGARRGPEVAAAMADTGLLGPLLQAVAQPRRLARLVAIEPGADAMLRLAAIAVFVREDAIRLREALRLSNAGASRLEAAAEALQALPRGMRPPDAPRLRRLLFAHGRLGARDGLLLAWAENGAAPDEAAWLSARGFIEDAPELRLPFAAADLIARGVPAGRSLGLALKSLEAAWIDAGLPQDPQRLAELLAATLAPRPDR